MTTDDFFSKNHLKFDLIFIDAWHEKNQVMKDFVNSFDCLNENGIIVLHDINPWVPEHTEIHACGDCFAFWMQLVKIFPLNTKTFQNDNKEDTVGLFFKNNFVPQFAACIGFGSLSYKYEEFDKQRSFFIEERLM